MNLRPKLRKGRTYKEGSEVPDQADLTAFNAGWFLGISALAGEKPKCIRNLYLSFLNGILQGVMYRFQCSRPKAARLLKITSYQSQRIEKMENVRL